jgi:predicted ribosomally synthesized peptide with nif11-like leader
MNENLKLFLEKVASDQELQTKFAQIKDVDEGYTLASSVQNGFTKEEFIEAMSAIKAAMEEDLSDEDLAKSAGGGLDENDIISIVTGTVSATVSAATCAASAAV